MSLTINNYIMKGTSLMYVDIRNISDNFTDVQVQIPYGKINGGTTRLFECVSSCPENLDSPTTMAEFVTQSKLQKLSLELYVDAKTALHTIRGTVPVYGAKTTKMSCAFHASQDINVSDDNIAAMNHSLITQKGGELELEKFYGYTINEVRLISNVQATVGPFAVHLENIKAGTNLSSMYLSALVNTNFVDETMEWKADNVECTTAMMTQKDDPIESTPILVSFDFKPVAADGSEITFQAIHFNKDVYSFSLSCPSVILTSGHPAHPILEVYGSHDEHQDQYSIGLFGESATSGVCLATVNFIIWGIVASLCALM